MSNSGGRRIKRAIYLKVSSFVFCDDQMLEQFKKYAYKRLHPRERKKIKKSNSTLIENESNQLISKA
jgi:miniconductance mechanosensitive channel